MRPKIGVGGGRQKHKDGKESRSGFRFNVQVERVMLTCKATLASGGYYIAPSRTAWVEENKPRREARGSTTIAAALPHAQGLRSRAATSPVGRRRCPLRPLGIRRLCWSPASACSYRAGRALGHADDGIIAVHTAPRYFQPGRKVGIAGHRRAGVSRGEGLFVGFDVGYREHLPKEVGDWYLGGECARR